MHPISGDTRVVLEHDPSPAGPPTVTVECLTSLAWEVEALERHAARHLIPSLANIVRPILAGALREMSKLDCILEVPAGDLDTNNGITSTCLQLIDGYDHAAARVVLERAAREIVSSDPFKATSLDQARDILGLPYESPVERRRRRRRSH